ncbi:hypothetical protein [Ornithobacterium rhinotracheale]|uniref:hypothetical protein n=2 Tax=Ornithobacterium rhinotracheale TaxID=28251 RepID=UPI001FF559AD|nr:hypothetical protein [Ornithobacterium rhinotracheale]MCK0199912.1 hypothetical protein [Ornithobacterium rhinotracheale]
MNSLYPILKTFHSYWAFVVVLGSLSLLITSILFFLNKKPISLGLKKISLYTLISFHIQFLVGIILYMVSPIVQGAWESGVAMQSPNRLYTVEHPFMMFTAVILITIANAKLKKSPVIKGSTLAFIALACICFYMIPWTAWLG